MKRIPFALLGIVAAGVLLAGGFVVGQRTAHRSDSTPAAASASAPSGERKVLYWHDPMVPGARFDKPGKSPFMDMQLVPVYADEAASSGVRISPQLQQNLGVRTAKVRRAQMSSSFDAIGAVQFDERLSVAVQTRVPGYVERLAVRATMEQVRKGEPLATVFAPDWLGPLNELVALERAGVSADLIAAAHARLRALSVPEALVRQAEEGGTAQARFTLSAPIGGVVAELGVREGSAVTPGMTLFRIAGLDRVWAVAEVPEAQAIHLQRGQKVRAVLQADASRTFSGELKEILPQVNAGTRTLQARFEVDNRKGQLTPGMLLRLEIAGPSSMRLVAPTDAVIRTGTRAVAVVRKADGTFEPRELALGAEVGNDVEVTQGLAEGDEVVVSGQFLIDSEARLRSVLDSMTPGSTVPSASAPAAPASSAAALHVGEGTVESVTADAITISHGPVPTLKWPAMTMGFAKPASGAFSEVKPGDRLRFEFREGGPSGYQLVTVQRLGGTR